MLDTWHLTDEEVQKLPQQSMQKTQQAREQGYEVFAIGDSSQGKIIAVLAQPKSSTGRTELPHVLTEGTN